MLASPNKGWSAEVAARPNERPIKGRRVEPFQESQQAGFQGRKKSSGKLDVLDETKGRQSFSQAKLLIHLGHIEFLCFEIHW